MCETRVTKGLLRMTTENSLRNHCTVLSKPYHIGLPCGQESRTRALFLVMPLPLVALLPTPGSSEGWFSVLANPQLIPWYAAVLLLLAVGGLFVQNRQLRKQGLYFDKLRTRVLEAKEPIRLLDLEAQQLLLEAKKQFDQKISSSTAHIGVSRDQTLAVVNEFKQKLETALNGIMRAVSGELAKVVSHASTTQDEAKQTREVLSATTELIDRKDREIRKLQEGYQTSLLKPLLQPFMEVKDELERELNDTIDPHAKEVFSSAVKQIDAAFDKVGVIPTKIRAEEDPERLPVHFWEALPSAQVTDRADLQGRVFRVAKPGYHVILPGLDEANGQVLRKAVVIRYRFEPPQPAPDHTTKPQDSSPADPSTTYPHSRT